MKVFGFGEKKTPYPFIAACDKFIYLEILKSLYANDTTGKRKNEHEQNDKQETIQQIDKKIVSLISSTANDIADEDGWAFLGDVGNLLIKKKPDFDPRNYGFDKLTPLIKSLKKDFEIDERMTERASIKLVYIKTKK